MAFSFRSEFCFPTTNILRQVKRHCFLWLRLCCSAGQVPTSPTCPERTPFPLTFRSPGRGHASRELPAAFSHRCRIRTLLHTSEEPCVLRLRAILSRDSPGARHSV